MGNQIIRQPDGHFAIFSSERNTIIIWDATEDEIVEWFAEQAADLARQGVRHHIQNVAAGEAGKSYGRRTMTWEEALTEDRKHGGEASKEASDG